MQFDNTNKPIGIKRICLAFKNSQRALTWLAKKESAFKQELILFLLAIAVVIVWQITLYEKIMLLVSVLFVMFAEVVNTAIEATIDRVSLEIHPLSGLAKDLGSAAVFIASKICALIWGGVIFNNLG